MKWLLCLMIGLAYSSVGRAAETNHFEVLKESKWFAISGGIANTATPEAYAVAALCRQTNAVAQFQRLLEDKSAAQQLYGLLGLSSINAPEFKTALPALLKSTTKVQVLEGCIAGEREVAEIARQIESKRWRLPAQLAPGGKETWRLIE